MQEGQPRIYGLAWSFAGQACVAGSKEGGGPRRRQQGPGGAPGGQGKLLPGVQTLQAQGPSYLAPCWQLGAAGWRRLGDRSTPLAPSRLAQHQLHLVVGEAPLAQLVALRARLVRELTGRDSGC